MLVRRHAGTNSSEGGHPGWHDFLLFWVKLELVLALAASLGNFAVWVRRIEEVEAGSSHLWGLVQLHCLMSKKHKQSESNDDLSSLQAFNICPVFDRYKHNGGPRWRHVYFRRWEGEGSLINKTDTSYSSCPNNTISDIKCLDRSFRKMLHNCSKTAAEWDRS